MPMETSEFGYSNFYKILNGHNNREHFFHQNHLFLNEPVSCIHVFNNQTHKNEGG